MGEVHPKLNYQVCSSSGCKTKHTSVVIDSDWRWTHVKGETTNCYTGNLWDPDLCPDAATCSKNCEIEGADKEYNNTYGVSSSADGNSLSLKFVTEGPYTTNVGSRLYMLNAGSEDKYKMFRLKNREFTFTVDDSQIDCGLNGALYFVAMDADGGVERHGTAGANYGTGYCDAQCPHDLKWINNEANVEDWVPSELDENAGTGKYGTCCTEIDLWEANHISTAFTMHSCATPNDLQYRCHGTDCGTIDKVKQFYTQGGKTIEHPMYTINGNKHKTISDDMCKDWVGETKDGTNFLEKGGMGAVDTVFKNGAVLVMSLWDDHYANMLWLDSTYPVDQHEACKAGKGDPGTCRGSCDITTGVPADVEKDVATATIHFSDIKYGYIGTTVDTSDAITV